MIRDTRNRAQGRVEARKYGKCGRLPAESRHQIHRCIYPPPSSPRSRWLHLPRSIPQRCVAAECVSVSAVRVHTPYVSCPTMANHDNFPPVSFFDTPPPPTLTACRVHSALSNSSQPRESCHHPYLQPAVCSFA